MLRFLESNRILRELNCGLVVEVQRSRSSDTKTHVVEKVTYVNAFARRQRAREELRLSSGSSDRVLQPRPPSNKDSEV